MCAFMGRYCVCSVVEVDAPDPGRAYAWARAQIGKKYDYGAVARFISKLFGKESPDRFHCVELVEGALSAAGRTRFRVPLNRVTVRQSYMVL